MDGAIDTRYFRVVLIDVYGDEFVAVASYPQAEAERYVRNWNCEQGPQLNVRAEAREIDVHSAAEIGPVFSKNIPLAPPRLYDVIIVKPSGPWQAASWQDAPASGEVLDTFQNQHAMTRAVAMARAYQFNTAAMKSGCETWAIVRLNEASIRIEAEELLAAAEKLTEDSDDAAGVDEAASELRKSLGEGVSRGNWLTGD